MVNATGENGCCDATSELSTLTPEEGAKNVSSSKLGICGLDIPPEGEGDGADVPSPVGSECWRNPNSSDALMRMEAMFSAGATPVDVIKALYPRMKEPPEGWTEHLIMSILAEILDRPPTRSKLTQYNTFEDAVELFKTRKRILILTGAGVSVSCGIPDFRSKDGIYARLHVDFPDLPDPTAMFDIRYFSHNPAPFYDFASEIFPGQFEPSISHKFIRQLEVNNQLLRNYTQNIDTLEKQAKIERVVECHGSFSKATCLKCFAKFDGDVIKDDVLAKRVPHCPKCMDGIIKPDIVFFGEELGNFHTKWLLIKMNSICSWLLDLRVKVRTAIDFTSASVVDPNSPQILINSLPGAICGSDEIIEDICIALGGPFVEMLEAHQNKVNGHRGSETNGHSCHAEVHQSTNTVTMSKRKRRRIAEKQEFLQIMKQLEISESSEKNGDMEYSTEVKRPRLEDMYQRRYIPVAKHLPEHTYFQISSNRAIFPGAELYYDLETGAVCQPTSYR
ncbi:transcriptional regulator, Sir2 family [Cooperia oncophora]